ncbi:MAG: SpoIVB peptidase [Christensenellales bacterium]
MKRIRKGIGIIFAAAFLTVNFSPQVQSFRSLPDELRMQSGQTVTLDLKLPLVADFSGGNAAVLQYNGETLRDVTGLPTDQSLTITASQGENASISLSLFGVVPIKTIAITVGGTDELYIGGQSIGVTMYTRGALIVGTTTIVEKDGTIRNPAEESGLKPGDVILQVGDESIDDADHLASLIDKMQGEQLVLKILRSGEYQMITVTAAKDENDGKYRLGLWVRDSTAGVGTLTFYVPGTKVFASLGHAITDVDTRENLLIKNGEIVRSRILDIRLGTKGTPGELHGSLESAKEPLGVLLTNTDFGIYGKLYEDMENTLYPKPIPIGCQKDVHPGAATILTTVDDKGVKEYSCEITRVTPQSEPSPKGMVIRITDPDLLRLTGGIVQGMSGSPILQDGKIIGAITHVFVNDPTQGYGLYIDWMMEQVDEIMQTGG